MSDVIKGQLGQLRYEPTDKRVRAMVDGQVIVDSTHALLVWEPRRRVPSYAVPVADVRSQLVAAVAAATSDAPFLRPGIPFTAHSCPGTALNISVPEPRGESAAFRPEDPDLVGFVVLDFLGFDAWYEEEELIVGHPRDPFHRVDIRRSSRAVRIVLDGQFLAESAQPRLVFETFMPVRFYLPRSDVLTELRPSGLRTHCAYKGEASYWSVNLPDAAGEDLAWSYEDPLSDAAPLAGLVAFFDDRVDVFLDGALRPRTGTAPR